MKKRADTAAKTRRKRDATMKKLCFLTMRHRIGRHEKQKRISPPPVITEAHAS